MENEDRERKRDIVKDKREIWERTYIFMKDQGRTEGTDRERERERYWEWAKPNESNRLRENERERLSKHERERVNENERETQRDSSHILSLIGEHANKYTK